MRGQWDALRRWLEETDILRHESQPSGLAGWTVRDLVVHLGFGLVMLDEVQGAPPEAEPLSVGAYIAQYKPAASAIRAATVETSARTANVLESLDSMASRAWAALDRPRPSVVMGRRGPLTYDDFLVTRLIELVVHGDDLERAVHVSPAPLMQESLDVVAHALNGAYALRAGTAPSVNDARAWIRTATGRVSSSDPNLPLL